MPSKNEKQIKAPEIRDVGVESLAQAVIHQAILDRKWNWLFDNSEHLGSAHYWMIVAEIDDPTAFQETLLKQLGLPHKTLEYYVSRNSVYVRAKTKRKKGKK